MCAPVLGEARRIWPVAEITLMGRRHNCELFAACRDVDRIYQAGALPFSIRNRRAFRGLRQWAETNRFDIAIILLGDDFAALLASIDVPVRVGPRGTLLESCLTHLFDCATPRTWGPPEKLNSLRALGFDVPDIMPRLSVSDSARSTARKTLAGLGIRPKTPYAVIHPFGSEPSRWWPLDRVDELSRALTDRMGLATVLIGGADIRKPATLASPRHFADAVGAFSICELLAAIENCTVVVSTDSGPYHIAGALARPTVGLFRASRPEHITRYASTRNVAGNHPDCDHRCGWDRCRHDPCRQMTSIEVPQVMENIEMLVTPQRMHSTKTDGVEPVTNCY